MIQSVNRALDILLAVSDGSDKPVTLSSIAEKTQLNNGTCAHIVKTLCERGFLLQVSRNAGYILGPYSYYLVRHGSFRENLRNSCTPVLRWLGKQTGHTALLAVIAGGEKFVISYDEEYEPLKQRGDLFKGSLYGSATGRAMMAAMNEEELETLLKHIGYPEDGGWIGVKSTAALKAELKRIEKEKVVCLQFSGNNKTKTVFGIALRIAKYSAIGISVITQEPLSKEEKLRFSKYLLKAELELYRRSKYDG